MSRNIRSWQVAGVACLVAFGVVASVSAVGPADQDERTVYVSVMGGNGSPVPDMTQAEFLVKEDGEAREIVKVERAMEPVQYAILVDTTPSATSALNNIREALTTFCRLVLGASPDTKIAFIEFGGASMVARDFTSNLAELEAAIPKLVPKPSEPVLNEALVDISRRMAEMPGPRRVIVTLNMEPTGEASRVEVRQVAEEVRKSGAVVWSISLQTGTRRDANREQLLKGLAANTGGLQRVLQNNPTPLPQFFISIAANSLAQYAVTFRRPAGQPMPKVTDVTVTRQGVLALSMKWSK